MENKFCIESFLLNEKIEVNRMSNKIHIRLTRGSNVLVLQIIRNEAKT